MLAHSALAGVLTWWDADADDCVELSTSLAHMDVLGIIHDV